MCVFNIQDYGGIINHAEHLIWGLRQLGHRVTLVRMDDTDVIRKSTVSRELERETFSGLPLDQRWGWAFPPENRVPMQTVNWRKYTSPYDLVIWEVPVPAKQDETYFRKLYGISVPQVAFIHDGNAVKMYPHIAKLKNKIDLFACVHPCAYGNMQSLGVSNCNVIPNPQVLWTGRMEKAGSRPPNVVSFQTFKAWKRVDELVRAVPYISAGKVTIGGGGIEYYYMTSDSKRKAKYGDIWEKAVASGMNYIGYVGERERDSVLRESRFLVDASWSNTYAVYGSHFNRVMVDAIIRGVVPILRDKAMQGNGYFRPGKHYVEVPHNATAKEFAGIINDCMTLPDAVRDKMIRSGQKVVRNNFEARKVASELLDCIR